VEERKIGPSNYIIVDVYMCNYMGVVTAVYKVRYHTLQAIIYPCASHSFEWKMVGMALPNPI
jgi:hypothetical protein